MLSCVLSCVLCLCVCVCGSQPNSGNVTTTTPTTNPNYRAGDWMCKCGNHNFGSRTACKKCNLSKDEGKDTFRVAVPEALAAGGVGG